ncbi:MAG: 16S rRNA (guanine(966)-N(2))-methyltransferase RsmD [Verrucomicrobiales bacterium]|nr:16S rRNA (guanine(966)-N(2))-methyltransferase RsmD [Verrucomicrobiales bacterium]
MRIIGGSAAGRLIKVPSGYDVRPTPDLVRQAIFNSLGGRVDGARVLDLFSGSGAIGLECLSRGAASVLSVEKAGRHASMIRQNLELTALPTERHELRVQDVLVVLRQLAESQRTFDLIMADPPFGDKNVGKRSTSLSQRLLDDEYLPKLISPDGLLVLGHTKRDTLTLTAAWDEMKEMKHGDSMMRFLRPKSPAPATSQPELSHSST